MDYSQALLLINLGSPDSPNESDVKRYLDQFLMDPYVIDVPYLLRLLLIRGIVLRSRPAKTAEAYRAVWTSEGAPLLVISRQLRDLVQEKVTFPVGLGMRYGNPSISSAIQELIKQCGASLKKLHVLPLYPHFALSSTQTALDEVYRAVPKSVQLHVIRSFYDHPDYIQALVAQSAAYLKEDYDHILFSYHGLPERHLRKADPTQSHCLSCNTCCDQDSPALATCYRAQVLRTTRAFMKASGSLLPYSVAFQSRLGPDKWLTPSTPDEIARLQQNGVKRLLMMSPSFVSDCLETLEELGMRAKEDFMAAGGEVFTLIPCLNTHPAFVDAIVNIGG